LAGKILDVLGMYQVGTCLVLCPFPCDVLAMYRLGTLALAPSVDNLSIRTEPQSPGSSQSSALSSQHATPSTTALSLPSYHSPEPESLYSDSGFTPGPRRLGHKTKEINYVVSDEDEIAFDEAYAEGVKLYISSATNRGEPCSYREATSPNNPDSKQWIEAVQTELKSLQGHGTWEIVPRPEGKCIVTCK